MPLSQATMESDKAGTTPSDGINSLQRVHLLHGRTSGPTRRSRQWNTEEDEILRKAVQHFKAKSWKKIAEFFKDRTETQCLHRWQKVLDPELVKGSWSKEEDDMLLELVNKHGPKKWSAISKHLPGRIGKQCRERWHNHLNPAISKETWTQEEELALIRAHQICGNKWAELSKYLPGRTDNAIKNHWNSSVKKKLDSYLASGLLTEFSVLANVNHQNHSVPSSSSSMKLQPSSEDETIREEGTEVEEVSECSQVSTLASDLGNRFVHTAENDKLSQESICKEASTSSAAFQDVSFTMPEDPDELADFSGIFMHYLNAYENHDMVPLPSETATRFGETSNVGNMVEGTYNPDEVFTCVDDYRIPQCSQSDTVVNGSGEPVDSLIYQSSSFQIPEAGDMAPQNCEALGLDGFEESSGQPFSLQLSSEERLFLFGVASNQLDDPLFENMVQDSSRLVSVNDFGSTTLNTIQTCLLNENLPVPDEQKHGEGGALCYEPPRFPSLDVPFFCCDLTQSGSDTQQEEYSPLGIRQFMMTSVNSLTPLRLWDPSAGEDSSPDAILKSAAKTFTGTPSILKKRHRQLASPLSEKRFGKKLISDLNQESFSNEDKENHSCSGADYQKKPCSEGSLANDTMGKVKQPPGVLVDLSINDLFISPDRLIVKCDRATSSSNKAPCNQYARRLEAASNQATVSSSFDTLCLTDGLSPCVRGNHGSSVVIATSTQSTTSTALGNTAETSENGFGAQTVNITGETPFKRSIESPSAWKSPWFINSFLPSATCGTELSFEDIALFMSPREGSYDAIGLMKHLSEQTAASIADAHQILGSDTPETLPLGRCSGKQKADDNCSQLASNAMSERRTLDFGECGTPGKGKVTTKFSSSSSSSSFSSPNSYLLKSCR